MMKEPGENKKQGILNIKEPELGTLEWWISGLMLNPLFLLISRLT